MKKKALTLAIMMALTAGVVSAATPDKQDPNMYPKNVVEITQKAVAQNLANNMEAKKEVALDISEATQKAVANNLKVKSAREKYEAAIAKKGQAKSARNPKFNYGYKFSRDGSELETVNDTKIRESIGNKAGHSVSVSMPLYTGGMVSASVKAADLAKDIAYAQVMQAEAQAKVDGSDAYFKVLRANNMKDVAEKAVADLSKHLKNVRLQYQVGIVAKSDVLATEVAKANADTGLIKATNAVELAEANLNYALNLPSNTYVNIKDKEFAKNEYGITLQEATAYALTHRPEVVQAALATEIAKAQVDIAKAGFRPKVEIGANKTWGHAMPDEGTQAAAALAGRGLNGRQEGWSAYIGATWNFWDGGATSKNIKVAKETLASQEALTKDAIEGITLQVRQSYLNLQEALSTITSTKVAVEKAEESFRIASLRYEAGVGINLDVLDAELNLNKARNAYVDALYNYNLNVVTLEKAIGVPAELPIGSGLVQIHKETAQLNLR